MLSYKLFEASKDPISKKFISAIAKKHDYKVKEVTPTENSLGVDVKLEYKNDDDGINEYEEFVDELIKEIGDCLSEVYTEETGFHFKIYLSKPLNEKKQTQQTVLTRSYLTEFFKNFGFTLNVYAPNLHDQLYIQVTIEGDKANYEKALNRLISLNYRDIREINTVTYGKEMKIYIKDLN